MEDDKEYWKKLLGDDFDTSIFEDHEGQKPESGKSESGLPETPAAPAAPQAENPGGLGTFSVEHYDRDGNKASRTEPAEPDRPAVRRPSSAAPEAGQAKKPEGQLDTGKKDFEVNFNFDKEYADTHDKPETGVKKKREKRTGCLGGFFYFAFILGISIILASVGWLAATDVFGLGTDNTDVQVTVDKNYTISQVTDMLYNDGLIKYKSLFKLYAKFSKADQKIESGTYILNKNYDYRALVYGMTPSSGKQVEIDVTIPEGYTLEQIIALLNQNQVCSSEDLWDAAENYDFSEDYTFIAAAGTNKYRLEGYLFPDTYTFYVNDSPSRVLGKMLGNFKDKWTDEYQAKADALGYSQADIIKIASIIEKEATTSDRNSIASVIYNRIANPDASTAGYLGLDSTVTYACHINGVDFNTEYDSPYNTYKYPGLPAGPISNPGTAAIEAALNPASTSYYYFALGTDGTQHFFETYDGFTEFVNSDQFASNG